MPVERMYESASLPSTRAWACRNTTTRVPLPPHHLPFGAEQTGSSDRILEKASTCLEQALSLPFHPIPTRSGVGTLLRFQYPPSLTVCHPSSQESTQTLLSWVHLEVLLSQGNYFNPQWVSRWLLPQRNCSHSEATALTESLSSVTKPQAQQTAVVKVSPYLLLGTHLGAPSCVQLPLSLCCLHTHF